MKVVIIGSGLGGLLSGAALAKAGHNVEIFEKLPITGGRFTNIHYKGFKLSTGALHMIPHGARGPLGTMLSAIGAGVEIVPSKPTGVIRMENGNDLSYAEFLKALSFKSQLKFAIVVNSVRLAKGGDRPLDDWLNCYLNDEVVKKFADAFCGWSLSLWSSEVSTREIFAIIKNMYRYGGPGVPVGGCGAVTRSLAEVIKAEGGKIRINSGVDGIITNGEFAGGVIVNGAKEEADIVISDIGHQETSKLFSCYKGNNYRDYLEKISKVRSSAGIKICLSSDQPLLGYSGVLFTPFAERINGVNEVTNVDPSLAPDGKHLIMSHQTVRGSDIKKEISIGIRDLKKIFPGRKYEVLLVQSYSGNWPVNRCASGYDVGNETPLKNLFIVGDGAKGIGGIEVEGIALGVRKVLEKIDKITNQ